MSSHVVRITPGGAPLPSRDELPFLAFRRAHVRVQIARAELASAHYELAAALAGLAEIGYTLTASGFTEPGDPPVEPRSERA